LDNFEWDVQKAHANWLKHGVTFSDAVTALEDEQALTIEDDHPHEQRFITIGSDAFGRLVVVVYTYRSESIRIISARKATPGEIRVYQEGES
jgi:uncharacterized protein